MGSIFVQNVSQKTVVSGDVSETHIFCSEVDRECQLEHIVCISGATAHNNRIGRFARLFDPRYGSVLARFQTKKMFRVFGMT